LHEAAAEVASGERDADSVHRVLTGLIATEPRVQLDYAEVVDAHDLTPVTEITGDVLVAVAANVGRARLIDNMTVSVGPNSVDVDLGVVAQEVDS
jgi:pantothenate synthetase